MIYKFFPYLVFLLVVFSCKNSPNKPLKNQQVIICGAENTIKKNNEILFEKDGFFFGSAKNKTSEKAHSGKHSCKINKQRPFGLSISFNKIPKGAYVEVSAWKYAKKINSGAIVVSCGTGKKLYLKEHYPCVQEANGWKKIILNVLIPEDLEELKIYAHNHLEEDVFFDDLRIKYHEKKPTMFDQKKALNIQISKTDYKKIQQNRKSALKQGVIDKSLKSYFDAEILYKGKKTPIQIRLKGDWTDHLNGHKWSYRIKTAKGHAFEGMRSFSIQSPNTRSFLNEWIMHQFFKKEGVLTTRYTFMPVYINNVEMGVYAVEEHFEKQLLESKDKREGPILKFDEEGLWEMVLNYGEDGWNTIPYYESASVLPFKKKKTMKSPALKKQFVIGQNLLFHFKSNKQNLHEVFDVPYMSKYYALLDLLGGYHGMAWHNQRFYYNPVTSLLEPIGYDFSILEVPSTNKPRLVCLANMEPKLVPHYSFLNFNLIQQKPFYQSYLRTLNLVTSKDYQNSFYKSIKQELEKHTSLLSKEYFSYSFNVAMAKNHASRINNSLKDLKKSIKPIKKKTLKLNVVKKEETYLSETGLKAFMEESSETNSRISIANYHHNSIKITGYSIRENKDSLIVLKNPIFIDKYKVEKSNKKEIVIKARVKNLYFIPNKNGSILKKKVVSWPSPKFQNPRLELQKSHKFGKTHLYNVVDKKVVFSGKIIVDKLIYIPSDYEVFFREGTSIYLKNKSGIISHSPIQMAGTKNKPIKIGGDSTNQGIQVLQAKGYSTLEWATFTGLNTLKYNGWVLTGGVTFYESDVRIKNCVFEKNKCEDALNIIRSKFEMKSSLIQKTYADGFDGDFCEGKIYNSTFKQTKNDGIDFSGSKIFMKDCEVNQAGDKAVSGGEKSEIKIENLRVNNANIGVASKDNSKIEVSSSSFNNTRFVYATYQKKPEYGPAFIQVINSNQTNFKKRFLIDKGSTILYNNKKFTGQIKQDLSVILP